MPTLYLSPLQRLRNLFHLFCKEQLEQSQVVFSVVLSCYSSGKGSKEPGNKALETKAENMATPTFMQLYNFSSSYVKKKPSYFVNVSDTRCTEYEQGVTPGNKRCFYFFFFFSVLACSSPFSPTKTGEWTMPLITLLHVCLHLLFHLL